MYEMRPSPWQGSNLGSLHFMTSDAMVRTTDTKNLKLNTKNLNGLSGLAKKVLAHLVEEQ